ncbi:MAG: hypothetical protein R3Y64_03840 [Peptostreptococcaceae bacterium]
MRSNIFIRGELKKDPKINKDETVDIICVTTFEDSSRADASERGGSNVLIRFTRKQWKKIDKLRHKFSFDIMGDYKASVNKKGIPYIYVAPTVITKSKVLKPTTMFNKVQIKDEQIKHIDIINEKTTETPKKYVDWRRLINHKAFRYIPKRFITINENVDLKGGMHLDLESGRKFSHYKIVVKKTTPGRYELIAGLKAFCLAQIFDKKVSCYITDLTKEEFEEKYKVNVGLTEEEEKNLIESLLGSNNLEENSERETTEEVEKPKRVRKPKIVEEITEEVEKPKRGRKPKVVEEITEEVEKPKRGRKPKVVEEITEEIEKPKRGRKPKVVEEITEEIEKPKRGRKPKVVEETTEEVEKPKRGRKPKVIE